MLRPILDQLVKILENDCPFPLLAHFDDKERSASITSLNDMPNSGERHRHVLTSDQPVQHGRDKDVVSES